MSHHSIGMILILCICINVILVLLGRRYVKRQMNSEMNS
jgi:hypothetical protein